MDNHPDIAAMFRLECHESRSMTADVTLNCEAMLCPLPVLKARKTLMAMAEGAVLCVRATDPMAAIDLPHFCNEAGHTLISTANDGAVQLFNIRRGTGTAG